ncbi:MAG TPA: sigma-70 family RNA polymerase sigma factor [Candidatus Saccharimonadales bacterium]|nr:sigma-70 family RNA polymerase sigma factor [Candidatus Saccharimonadales bacterium]
MPARSTRSEVLVTDDIHNDLMRRIGRHRLLNAEEEISLAKRIERGDMMAKDTLVSHNLRLVASNARHYLGQGLPIEDLVNEGVTGLIRAAEKFDWRKGFRFSTYATLWIRQAMQRGIENQGRTIRMPVHQAQALRRMRKAEQKLTAQSGWEPSDEELAACLDWPLSKVEELKRASQSLASLDIPVDEDGERLFGDMIEDINSPSPGQVTEEDQCNARLLELVHELPPQQARILILLFGLEGREPITQASIARALGISSERVGQLKRRGLTHLENEHGSELSFLFGRGDEMDDEVADIAAEVEAKPHPEIEPTPQTPPVLHVVKPPMVHSLPSRKQRFSQRLQELQGRLGRPPTYLDLLKLDDSEELKATELYEYWNSLQEALQELNSQKRGIA